MFPSGLALPHFAGKSEQKETASPQRAREASCSAQQHVVSPQKSNVSTDSFSHTQTEQLTEAASKLQPSQKALLEKIDNHPKAQGLIGNLPEEWIAHLDDPITQNKAQRDIFKQFKAVADKIRLDAHGKDMLKLNHIPKPNETTDEKVVREASIRLCNAVGSLDTDHPDFLRTTLITEGLTDALQKYEITENSLPVPFTFVGAGQYGSVHKFSIKDKDYALKLYYEPTCLVDEYKEVHGSPLEASRAFFIKRRKQDAPDKGNFAKAHFADMEKGLMITDYIEDAPDGTHVDQEAIKQNRNESLQRIFLKDIDAHEANDKNGVRVDYGGLQIRRNELLEHHRARKKQKLSAD